ncbi:hypothetical protein AZE42_13162 [Rhizopogon vesiculosus]|uniref:CxC2-like cysteine cluster KDZ transposase-associated domain-containing protein n=1 Tax=Rhizopogon vesiculosus TaxID=180088 RepID=A0A1J8QEQ1_9AGAM|nr:hypothetical protein AZE42_13162 [Rhizopogon vesiculosus]
MTYPRNVMRPSQEWRILKVLQTPAPENVQLCPACPHPGKNLPEDWHDAPQAKHWLYALFVAINANFRLKRRDVSKDKVDPSLGDGWAYFVKHKDYKTYVKEHTSAVQEKSTCASHNAVNMADTKSNHGLATTGVGTINCARHNMKRGNGVGDLQKGERYVNMDYLFFSTLRGISLDVLNISYDIACQWHKKLWVCMDSLPSVMHLNHPNMAITFFIPKFHLPAHIMECQTRFSWNLIPGVGRTDGEAPECGWANINPVTLSTKEMGPGARWDTLDDHFGDWNWKKVVQVGSMMLHKVEEALPECRACQEDLRELELVIILEKPSFLAEWKIQLEEWEQD